MDRPQLAQDLHADEDPAWEPCPVCGDCGNWYWIEKCGGGRRKKQAIPSVSCEAEIVAE